MSDARLLLPRLEDDPEPWPTLGPEVCDFIEDNLVHGPGDVLGQPIQLTDEVRLFLYRLYEVYPRDHPQAGRRRFKRAVLSRRKGVGKTEIAMWVAIAELDPQAPVRCDGWRREGKTWVPVGRPVTDPYIPMVATTVEQVEDLAYGGVYAILTHDDCALVDDYDAGLERIVHRTAPGKMQPLAGAPSARDGARTTFQHFDETHLFTEPRLRKAHASMQRNIPKRRASDAFTLETTTMYGPGEGSIAEEAHLYAEAVARGEIADPRLLFDHRQASERHDITTRKGLVAAIEEASGDALKFADVESIVALADDLLRKKQENEFRRYWLNQRRKASEKWGPAVLWPDLRDPKRAPCPSPCRRRHRHRTSGWPDDGSRVVLAFDGSYSRDSTVLVGATVEARPYVFLVRAWERPADRPGWRTPRLEVVDEVAAAMERWDVAELAPDPPGWHREIEEWEQTYGDIVVRFETNQPTRMGPACDDFTQAVSDGDVTHDGSEVVARHLDNAAPVARRGYTLITKPDDTADKIDAAVGAVIALHRASWHHTNPPAARPTPFAMWDD